MGNQWEESIEVAIDISKNWLVPREIKNNELPTFGVEVKRNEGSSQKYL